MKNIKSQKQSLTELEVARAKRAAATSAKSKTNNVEIEQWEGFVDFRCKVPKGLMQLLIDIANREQINMDEVWRKFIGEAFEELSNTNARIKENLGA